MVRGGSLLLLALFGCAAAAPLPGEETTVEIEGQVAPPDLATGVGVSCANESPDAKAAREAVAEVRAWVHLPPLACDAQAVAAASGHCAYLDANHVLTHVQEKGKPMFTGVTMQDRLARSGFTLDPSGEVIATLTGRAAVLDPRGFLNSVYHRSVFLRAENTAFGYGGSTTCATFDFGRPKVPAASVSLIWPPDGATQVPRVFHADREIPNPIPGATLVGSPISWLGNGPLSKLDVKVFGPKGLVAVSVLTHEDDPAKLIRVGEVHVVPKEALSPRTQYNVTFRAFTGKTPLLARASFTTGD